MLRLKRPLRPSSDADPEDALATKLHLADLGFYEPPTGELHEWPDAELFAGVTEFQKAAGETPDGEMLPGGPTEAAINRSAQHEPHEAPTAFGGAQFEADEIADKRRSPSPGRPVNLSRCLDSREMGEQGWERFCRAIRNPLLRAGCWATAYASTTKCRNWCYESFGTN
jgi:hypothetical protein